MLLIFEDLMYGDEQLLNAVIFHGMMSCKVVKTQFHFLSIKFNQIIAN